MFYIPATIPGFNTYLLKLFACLFAILLSVDLAADTASARSGMENQTNPLLLVNTTMGDIYIELFPAEAPANVNNVLALAEGEEEIVDFSNGQVFTPRYYDGMNFHRVIPGLLVQTGSPFNNVFGRPAEHLADEINAISLGLDRIPVVLPDGSFNPILHISNRDELEQTLLLPLYRAMDITDNEEVHARQFEIDSNLRSLTLKQAYENLGYRYSERTPTRPINRGIVALANTGPNSNSSEFFICVGVPDWLNGRYTVIGRVVEGLNIVDQINQLPVNSSNEPTAPVLIYSIRRV